MERKKTKKVSWFRLSLNEESLFEHEFLIHINNFSRTWIFYSSQLSFPGPEYFIHLGYLFQDQNSECVTIPRSLDSRLQVILLSQDKHGRGHYAMIASPQAPANKAAYFQHINIWCKTLEIWHFPCFCCTQRKVH